MSTGTFLHRDPRRDRGEGALGFRHAEIRHSQFRHRWHPPPYKVNWLEEPYYGIPQETVDAVKAGEVQTEVDWVRVWGPAG
jgi:hypothetical protein